MRDFPSVTATEKIGIRSHSGWCWGKLPAALGQKLRVILAR
jgi:hypothetical protein